MLNSSYQSYHSLLIPRRYRVSQRPNMISSYELYSFSFLSLSFAASRTFTSATLRVASRTVAPTMRRPVFSLCWIPSCSWTTMRGRARVMVRDNRPKARRFRAAASRPDSYCRLLMHHRRPRRRYNVGLKSAAHKQSTPPPTNSWDITANSIQPYPEGSVIIRSLDC